MKKFLWNLFFIIFIPIVIIFIWGSFFLFLFAPQYKYEYTASIVDKIQRSEDIEVPKIILVGNSNVAFGFDSELIENEFNMPVVNLGLHGGLGNAFHEEMAKLCIKENDVVIVCHSSYSDNDEITNPELAWITLENNYNLYKIIRKKDFIKMLRAFPRYIYKGTILYFTHQGNEIPGNCYSRFAFNKYGDNNFPRIYDTDLMDFSLLRDEPQISKKCIDRMNSFNEYCKNKGASMYVAAYPIYRMTDEVIDLNIYNSFQSDLCRFLDCKVISNFSDYIFDETLFYNSILHLTNEGAIERTKLLINDIKRTNFLKKD